MQRVGQAREPAARGLHALRLALALLLSLVVVTISTTAMAAEFDPRLCPDAQATAANVVSALSAPVPDQLDDGRQSPPVSCTICCQNVPGAATGTAIIAPPPPPMRLALAPPLHPVLPTLEPSLPLDPPRS
jgi:hypothetical protein